MATVRLTDDLTKKILAHSQLFFDAQIEASSVPPHQFNVKDIYELWLDSSIGLREDIPIGIRHGWLVRATIFSVKSLNRKPVNIQCRPAPLPGVWVPYAIANSYGKGVELQGAQAETLLEIWDAWHQNFNTVRNNKIAFEAQIENLLKRHKTLKQALGEWPALWDFVPDHYKQEHNKEKERIAQIKRIERGSKPIVDLDVLNGSIVTAKILKGWMD
jgi:hypothetical protein